MEKSCQQTARAALLGNQSALQTKSSALKCPNQGPTWSPYACFRSEGHFPPHDAPSQHQRGDTKGDARGQKRKHH